MFQTTEQALEFAFNTIGRPVGSQCSLGKLGQPRGFGGLTAYDLHAQAAMIMSHLKSGRLSTLQYAMVIFIYGDGSERAFCKNMLAQYLFDSLQKSKLSLRAMHGYVDWYSLRNTKSSVSLREVARDVGECHNKMQYQFPRAIELLSRLQEQFEFILDDDFISCKIVIKTL